MRFRCGAGALAIVVLWSVGCRDGRIGGSVASGESKLNLAETPDIHTPPSSGHYTLQLMNIVDSNPAAEARQAARRQAEDVAVNLRKHGFPAFIMTRSIKRHGSKDEPVPVHYVCIGAFDKETSDDAAYARSYFRGRKVVMPGEKNARALFGKARFMPLGTEIADDVDSIVSLYDIPARARYGLVVGLFQGPDHKKLAREFALGLRRRGFAPLVQGSAAASRVLVGATEFKNDPNFRRLAGRLPRVEHNLLGFLSFRGTYKGHDHRLRARATENDLKNNGYDAFTTVVRLKPVGAPRGVAIEESRVFVVRMPDKTATIDDLRRRYADVKPHDAEAVAYRSQPVDLREGWDTDVDNPTIRPGRLGGSGRPRPTGRGRS